MVIDHENQLGATFHWSTQIMSTSRNWLIDADSFGVGGVAGGGQGAWQGSGMSFRARLFFFFDADEPRESADRAEYR